MTTHRSFKRLVRTRMEKTGESYTAARAVLLAAEDPSPSGEPTLVTSEAKIRERTGRGWEEWFDLLDDWGAAERSHRDIARWVAAELDIVPLAWAAQAVTMSYERARRGRVVGQRENGFTITASRTVATPVERLYEAFVEESARRDWLPDALLRLRTGTRPRSARFDGPGDSRVNVIFDAKSADRSTAYVEHARLTDADEAARFKTCWHEWLDALTVRLQQG